MNLEQTIETILREGNFATDWIEVKDQDLVKYIVGRIEKFSSLSKEEIEERFISYAHVYSASKQEYEKSSMEKVKASQKIKKIVEENKAIALTSHSLFIREMAKIW